MTYVFAYFCVFVLQTLPIVANCNKNRDLKQYASMQPSNQIESNFSRQSILNEHTYLNTNISAYW